MEVDRNTTTQPDLYKCDLCENYSTTSYGVNIHVDIADEQEDGSAEREYTYRLCRHCYYNWMQGQMSTRELIFLCNHNLDRQARERENAKNGGVA